MIKPLKEFPLMKEYSRVFPVTPYTVFALNNTIYSDFPLPPHLIIHENVHLRRQNKQGIDVWVEKFLIDKDFRLKEEVIAYKEQIKSIKDRESGYKLLVICARDLSSPLYGGICTFDEAMRLLRTN